MKFDGAHFHSLYAAAGDVSSASFTSDMKVAFKTLLSISMKRAGPFVRKDLGKTASGFDFDSDLEVDFGKDADDVDSDSDNETKKKSPTRVDEPMKLEESPQLKQLHEKIAKLFAGGDYDECLKSLQAAAKVEESCSKCRNMKAECLVLLERYDEAENIIAAAIADDPKDSNMLCIQGLKNCHELKLKDGIQKFCAAIRINRNFTKAMQLRETAQKMLKLINSGERRHARRLSNF